MAIIGESNVSIHTYPEASHTSIDIFTLSSTSQKIDKLLQNLREKYGIIYDLTMYPEALSKTERIKFLKTVFF